jgi:hypothetical protein
MSQRTLHTERLTLVPLADEHLEWEVELESDQGCTGQLAPVEFERFEGEPPPIRAFDRPPFAEQGAGP